MSLPFDTFGAGGDHEAWILHGILGSRRNWRAFTRTLAPRAPGWTFRTLDLRNHGDAPPLPGPHTLAVCAQDLVDTAEALGRGPDMVIGHSFGGKVALALAELAPPWLRGVCVLDAVPGPVDLTSREAESDDVVRLVHALERLPLPIVSHSALEAELLGQGFGPSLASWMTTNLTADGQGGLRWRFDLPGIVELLADYAAWDAWPAVERSQVPVHLLRALSGDRWTPDVLARAGKVVDGVRVTLDSVDSGHWVHVDAPQALQAWIVAQLAPTR